MVTVTFTKWKVATTQSKKWQLIKLIRKYGNVMNTYYRKSSIIIYQKCKTHPYIHSNSYPEISSLCHKCKTYYCQAMHFKKRYIVLWYQTAWPLTALHNKWKYKLGRRAFQTAWFSRVTPKIMIAGHYKCKYTKDWHQTQVNFILLYLQYNAIYIT